MSKKNNDPFGFEKAIEISVIDSLTPKELDEAAAAAGLGLSRSDFCDDGADLQDLKEISDLPIFDKCEKCKSDNLDFRSNYEWGEDWDPKKVDNIILCNDCGYEGNDS
jgi:hypothetical protein|tara:strand:+ start:139 stop:462 length:324 start_codon:yes stop_codon:yes gene_type:complete